jgi:hypothetical protein
MHIIPPETFGDLNLPCLATWFGGVGSLLCVTWLFIALI